MTDEARCHRCEEQDPSKALRRCPVCHKHFCEEHSYVMSGRPFCSTGCAEYFFFADPED